MHFLYCEFHSDVHLASIGNAPHCFCPRFAVGPFQGVFLSQFQLEMQFHIFQGCDWKHFEWIPRFPRCQFQSFSSLLKGPSLSLIGQPARARADLVSRVRRRFLARPCHTTAVSSSSKGASEQISKQHTVQWPTTESNMYMDLFLSHAGAFSRLHSMRLMWCRMASSVQSFLAVRSQLSSRDGRREGRETDHYCWLGCRPVGAVLVSARLHLTNTR